MLSLCDGTNTEIRKLLFISIEKTEEDIIISSENQDEENLFSLDTLLAKMSGMEMESV
jgi:hypothetical protein